MFIADYEDRDNCSRRAKMHEGIVKYYFDWHGWLTVYGDIPPAQYNHNYTIVPIPQPIDRKNYWYRFYRGQWEVHKKPTSDLECEGVIVTLYTGEEAYNSNHDVELVRLLKLYTQNSTNVKLQVLKVPQEQRIVFSCLPI